MLDKYTESDFIKIKDAAFDRLRPNNVPIFFVGTLVFSGVMLAVSKFAFSYSNKISPEFSTIISISTAAVIVHLLIAILFLFEKIAYKFQKLLAISICIVSFMASLETYQIYFLLCDDRNAPSFMTTLGLSLMAGGILFLVLSLIRAIKRVGKGEFRREGRGLFNMSDSKGYASLPFLFGIAMIAGTLPKIFSDNSTYLSIELYFALFLCFIIQYGIAAAWPEFFLLVHCKRKFDSFHVPMPSRRKKKGKKQSHENKAKRS